MLYDNPTKEELKEHYAAMFIARSEGHEYSEEELNIIGEYFVEETSREEAYKRLSSTSNGEFIKKQLELYPDDYFLISYRDRLDIENTIAAIIHEGYIDDGYLRGLLVRIAKGEITHEEADKIILERLK